jgi:hypothetical protein
MMGFKKDADLEEWKEYIKIWPTNVG